MIMHQDANFCQRQAIISLKNLAARYGSSLPFTFSATALWSRLPQAGENHLTAYRQSAVNSHIE